jgi:hypothetical protein
MLTLSEHSFSSMFDSGTSTCTWSGVLTAADAVFAIAVSAADGPPCDQALGTARSAAWRLSDNDNTLTLDWSGAGGTLQVYARL